ncbi:MAG: tetratricopeptide repeat protein [Bryobacteraceae bacterium]
MGNWTARFGFYINVLRVPLLLVCSLTALAQQPPQEDPFDAVIQAVWQAKSQGRFQEASAGRERARTMLQRMPPATPQFASWVQQVAQLYLSSSLNAQARTILLEALARTAPLGDSHPSNIALLSALADSWQQDGNLLKAAACLEQFAVAQTAAAAVAAQPGVIVSRNGASYFGGYFGSAINTYSRLANLYQQLGRPDAIAAVAAKIRELASNDPSALARFYAQQGQFEKAAAIYRTLAGQSADPLDRSFAWQSLANLYSNQEHYKDAIDAIQQAIAAVESSDESEIRSRAVWMRQNMANYMRQAGLTDQADLVYRQLLQQNQDEVQKLQILFAYALYLADTQRGAQGKSLLTNYLASRPDLEPQQQMNILFNLANLERRLGDPESADAYQQAGEALQPQPPAGQIRIGGELHQAETALRQNRLDDAYGLALDALGAAAQAADGQQVEWLVSQIASALAANKKAAEADRLFQNLFALAQNWSVDSLQPLIAISQNYAHFLIGQPDRASEVPAAIEQCRSVLIAANGPDSGTLAEPLRMQIEFERSQSQWEKAETSARELLELQEALTGTTSEPYLSDLQVAARVYEGTGDFARALPLFRKAVTIADLVASPNNGWRRSQTRMDAAFALAHLGQFDEAVMLGEEAVALERTMRSPRPALSQELAQIRQMKQDAATASARRLNQ